MKKALGMIEFKTVASGITATDIMLKTADVEVISAGPVCPGKYLATISGELSAVKAAIEAAERFNAPMLVDKFLLGNPHESVQPAICGALEVKNKGAIGILETFTAASAVVAADTAAKTALVDLIEVRLAKGMCGKSYVILTGSVSSVTAAIERAKAGTENGVFLDSSIIAGPDERLWESIL
ncbi:MAG: BMC domain-containing protein [Clostridia bacterium]|nr:BMC domain-containing protein [Clostridia bacterium]MBO7250755.1 BMC domain-containing protein [Clostridia bacterium]